MSWGLATHLVREHGTACGIPPGTVRPTPDITKVDCLKCRKTRLFRGLRSEARAKRTAHHAH